MVQKAEAAEPNVDLGPGFVSVERAVVCESELTKMWDWFSDTENLNRAVGLNAVQFDKLNDDTAARFLATTRLGGFEVSYEERPFEWRKHEYWHIHRVMRSGPIRNLHTWFRFRPLERGCEVSVQIALEPKIGLLGPILKLTALGSLKDFEREIKRIDALPAQGPRPDSGSHSKPAGVAIEQCQSRMAKRTEHAQLRRQLLNHIAQGADADLVQLRPYALAAEWQVPRRDVLQVCLESVEDGLLELSWALICPSCQVGSESVATLDALDEHGYCQFCDLDFPMDMNEAVEAVFRPSEAIRQLVIGPFCIGGPGSTPHVVEQRILPSHGKLSMGAPGVEGIFQVAVRGHGGHPLQVTADGPTQVLVEGHNPPSEATIRTGGVIEFTSPFSDERHAKLQRSQAREHAVTAREITSLASFRRQFSDATLRPGLSLQISRVSLLFSDLSDSTQLYSDVGDAAAFQLVQDHFDLLIGTIEKADGSIVKTIGDAIMAVFQSEQAAIEAATSILKEFEPFRQAHAHRKRTHIKLGVYSGPCYAVNANGTLDYFGQTVNTAARLQGQAKSGELILTAEAADSGVKHGYLEAGQIGERYAAQLKGIELPVDLARIRIR